MTDKLNEVLSKLLADTYALYLKSQNYHWHVKGANFKTLHLLFEEHYQELANAVDEIAERILTLGHSAPATFTEFNKLKSIGDGDNSLSADGMVEELVNDHSKVVKDLYSAMKISQAEGDEGTIALLSERIASHEKMRWMLSASRA